MKELISGIIGFITSIIISFFGNFDNLITILFIFIVIDYLSGIIVAGIYKKSSKTESGSLSSVAGWKGIFKKVMELTFVGIGHYVDIILGLNFIRINTGNDALPITIAYILNELLSIVENAGLMGVYIPAPVKKAIDLLNKKVDDIMGDNNDEKRD